MYFEKNHSLSGYPITIADNDYFYDPTVKDSYKIRGFDGRLLREIYSPLQPTINIVMVPSKSFTINENGTVIGPSLLKIFNGTYDTRAATNIQLVYGDFWRNNLNLYRTSGICYAVADVTAKWGEYFEQNYFLHVFVSTIYVCLIIEEIITRLSKYDNIDVTMDFLRASIGNATIWEPKQSFKRFLFLLIIFSFTIVSSYLQSELTSFIAVTPTEEVKLEEIDDFIKNNYEVYTTSDHRIYFTSSPYYHKIKTPFGDCLETLKGNASKACAHYCLYLKNIDLPENVRILQDKNFDEFVIKMFPIDYPILPRIRNIYYKLHEGGIISNNFKQYESKAAERETIVDIQLDELRYTFYFLLYGCLLAVFVFLIEVINLKFIKYLQEFVKKFFHHNLNWKRYWKCIKYLQVFVKKFFLQNLNWKRYWKPKN